MTIDPIQIRAAAELELRRRKLAIASANRYAAHLDHIWPWQVPPDDVTIHISMHSDGNERIRKLEDVPEDEREDGEIVTRPWKIWKLQTGRGAGKTRGGTEYVRYHLNKYGPDARVGVGAPSFAGARDVCMEGRAGLHTLYKNEFIKYNRAIGEAWHIRGGRVRLIGSENPDRWNGPEFSLIWADELALWNEDSWEMALFCLRVGEYPQAIITTTPKQRPFVQELENEATTVVTNASTKDNKDTPDDYKKYLYAKYGGTRLGVQELEGKWINDVEGALFKREWIENHRDFNARTSNMRRIVVAVDPAMTHYVGADETAVAAVGIDKRGHFYVFSANGYHLTPEGWARKVIETYNGVGAQIIIGESNNGGEMVRSTIRSVDDKVQVKLVHAYKGKKLRGEPVAALYEQGKVHHVGVFGMLEDQMCSFTGDDDQSSAVTRRATKGQHFDRMDTIVYGITDLMLRCGPVPGAKIWTADRKSPWRVM